MCRASLALYTWCHCEEAQLVEPCHSGRVSPSGSCDSISSETIRLHCYCRYHAEKGFLSAHKDNKKQKKSNKRKDKRRSMDSTSSVETMASDSSSASAASSQAAGGRSPGRLRKSWVMLRKMSSFD